MEITDKPQPIPVMIVKPPLTNKEKEKIKFWKDFKKDFIAGSISGAAVTIATQPLDTWAVREQADTGKKVLKNLRRVDRVKHLYKGVTPRLLKSTAAGAIGYPVFMAAAKKIESMDKTSEMLTLNSTPNAGKPLPKLYHSADPAEFGRSRRMPTSEAIEYLTKSWTHRPINIGRGKEYYGPRPITKTAGIGSLLLRGAKALKSFNVKNFMNGFLTRNATRDFGGKLNAMKNKSFGAGVATNIVGGGALAMAAPKIKNTGLETGMRQVMGRSPRSSIYNSTNI